LTLNALEPSDPRWLRTWEAWSQREPYAHPAFARWFAGAGERPFALLGEDAGGQILFPLLDRPAEGGGRDLGNPYGYGGPHRIGNPDVAAFWQMLLEWARGEGYGSLSSRLSLEEGLLALPLTGVVEVQPNVVRELNLDAEALVMDYEHKVRKNVKKAVRNGLTVEFDFHGTELDAFHDIYLDTMRRNEAPPFYHFDLTVFEGVVQEMPGSFLFAHVRKGAEIVSTELVLRSVTSLFSFLGGTRAEAFEDRPNDLLKHEVALFGIREGYARYILGGGVGGKDGGEDGIYRYKLAFAPHGRRPFRVIRLDLGRMDQAGGYA